MEFLPRDHNIKYQGRQIITSQDIKCTIFGIAEATALADTDVGDVAVTVEQCVVHSVA